MFNFWGLDLGKGFGVHATHKPAVSHVSEKLHERSKVRLSACIENMNRKVNLSMIITLQVL